MVTKLEFETRDGLLAPSSDSPLRTLLFLGLILLIGPVSSLHAQDIQLNTRYNYYTEEDQGHLLIWGQDVQDVHRIQVFSNDILLADTRPDAFDPVVLAFSLQGLAYGKHMLSSVLELNDGTTLEKEVEVVKHPPHPNAVKVDRLTSGLIVQDMPFYPFGFYTGFPLGTLPIQEVYNGFNMLGVYQPMTDSTLAQRKAYMDLCASIGMKVNYALNSLVGAGHNAFDREVSLEEEQRQEALLRREVETFRDHPALLSWYLNDEPLGQSRPIDVVEKAYRLVKEMDPYHPVSIVFMMPHRAREFESTFDIAMTDPYPVPMRGVEEAGVFVKHLNDQFQYKKAIWLVPQAFGGSEFWTREPTKAEIRAMTYLGLIEGAMGIQYFIRRGPNLHPKSPVAWHEASELALETQAMMPWLFSDTGRKTLDLEDETIQVAYWQKEGSILLMLVNSKNQPRAFDLKVASWSTDTTAFSLFENRITAVRGGRLEDFIDGYGTRVYVLGDTGQSDKIHPRNIVLNPGFEHTPSPGTPSGGSVRAGQASGDTGATYFVDARTSVQGLHSLRMIAPKDDQGMTFQFYPVKVETDASYLFSFWGRSDGRGAGSAVDVEIKELDITRSFTLSPDWQEYHFHFTVDQPLKALHAGITQRGSGTVWFDLVQIIPDPIIAYTLGDRAAEVDITSLTPSAEIRYTVNGGLPGARAMLYEGPFRVDSSATVHSVLMKDGQVLVRAKQYIPMSKASNKAVVFQTPYSAKYSASGDHSLVDGVTGTLSFQDNKWLGFLDDEITFTVDLGKPVLVSRVVASFLVSVNDGIHAPLAMEVQTSEDGVAFTPWGQVDNPEGSRAQRPYKLPLDVHGESAEARYVQVRIKGIKEIPEGFLFKGSEAWVFIDEVEVH